MKSRSEKYRQVDRKFLWHPYSSHSTIRNNDFPVIVRGKGPFLYDAEGKKYFDAISSWWCCSLGHSHPRIVAAIKKQAGKLQHSILGNMSHPGAIELAEKLADLFQPKSILTRGRAGQPVPPLFSLSDGPTGLSVPTMEKETRRVFFASDGSSALEAALKIAAQYFHNIGRPERNRFVSLSNAYHGDTLGSVSAGFLPQFHRQFKPLTFPVFRAKAPFCAECGHGGTSCHARGASPDKGLSRPTCGASQVKALHDNPDPCNCECFKSMKKIIEKHSEEIAGVIVEPLCQCAAGMRMYPPAYLEKLAQLCRAHKILLIADEIAVGFGRTGKMFAFEHAGIDPDIVCLGKSLSGGYLPISATVVKENIYSTFSDRPKDNTFYHGHTFAGNPIACAAALEVLKIYKEKNIVPGAARKGRIMAGRISRLNSIEGVRNARCLGMIAAFELEGKGGAARAQSIKKYLWDRGVLVRPLGNDIYLMPPLNTPDELITDAINLLAEALDNVL
jgi:adenosylmethionine-8-amino-7-oxononanoate aminotransferase